jgi:hypothetical protein
VSSAIEKTEETDADHPVAVARMYRRHREMLVAATAVVVLAFLLEVHSDQRVAFSVLPSCPLPATCLSRSLLHIECPGCGLTRSFIYLAHGDWRASWNVHRVGWFLALAVVLQIPYRLAALRSHSGLPLGTTAPKFFGTLLVVLLLVNWLINLISRLLN